MSLITNANDSRAVSELPSFVTYRRRHDIARESVVNVVNYYPQVDEGISKRRLKRRVQRRVNHVKEGMQKHASENVSNFLARKPSNIGLPSFAPEMRIILETRVTKDDIKYQVNRAKEYFKAKEVAHQQAAELALNVNGNFISTRRALPPVDHRLSATYESITSSETDINQRSKDDLSYSQELSKIKDREAKDAKSLDPLDNGQNIQEHDEQDDNVGILQNSTSSTNMLNNQQFVTSHTDRKVSVTVMGEAPENLPHLNASEVPNILVADTEETKVSLENLVALTERMKEQTLAMERGSIPALSVSSSRRPSMQLDITIAPPTAQSNSKEDKADVLPPIQPIKYHFDARRNSSITKFTNKGQPYVDISTLLRQASKVQTPFSIANTRKRNHTHGFNPTEKWRFAIRSVIKVMQTLKYSRTQSHIYRNIVNGPTVNDRSLAHALKEFKTLGDLGLTSRIQHYLTKERKEEDIATLNRLLLTRLSLFSKFSYNQRIRFCGCMEYEAHRKGAVIIKQGQKPSYFYFILSGQVEALKARSDGFEGQVRVALMNVGDYFGEVPMDSGKEEKRSSTIECTVPSEFLRVDIGILKSE